MSLPVNSLSWVFSKFLDAAIFFFSRFFCDLDKPTAACSAQGVINAGLGNIQGQFIYRGLTYCLCIIVSPIQKLLLFVDVQHLGEGTSEGLMSRSSCSTAGGSPHRSSVLSHMIKCQFLTFSKRAAPSPSSSQTPQHFHPRSLDLRTFCDAVNWSFRDSHGNACVHRGNAFSHCVLFKPRADKICGLQAESLILIDSSQRQDEGAVGNELAIPFCRRCLRPSEE